MSAALAQNLTGGSGARERSGAANTSAAFGQVLQALQAWKKSTDDQRRLARQQCREYQVYLGPMVVLGSPYPSQWPVPLAVAMTIAFLRPPFKDPESWQCGPWMTLPMHAIMRAYHTKTGAAVRRLVHASASPAKALNGPSIVVRRPTAGVAQVPPLESIRVDSLTSAAAVKTLRHVSPGALSLLEKVGVNKEALDTAARGAHAVSTVLTTALSTLAAHTQKPAATSQAAIVTRKASNAVLEHRYAYAAGRTAPAVGVASGGVIEAAAAGLLQPQEVQSVSQNVRGFGGRLAHRLKKAAGAIVDMFSFSSASGQEEKSAAPAAVGGFGGRLRNTAGAATDSAVARNDVAAFKAITATNDSAATGGSTAKDDASASEVLAAQDDESETDERDSAETAATTGATPRGIVREDGKYTCYLNSLLQCSTVLPAQLMQTTVTGREWLKVLRKLTGKTFKGPLRLEDEKTLIDALAATESVGSSQKIFPSLRRTSAGIQTQQEDLSEGMVRLLDYWRSAQSDENRAKDSLTLCSVYKRLVQLRPGGRGVTRHPMGEAQVCPCSPTAPLVTVNARPGSAVLSYPIADLSETVATRLQAVVSGYHGTPTLIPELECARMKEKCPHRYEAEEWIKLAGKAPPYLVVYLVRWSYYGGALGYSAKNENRVTPDKVLKLPFHPNGVDKPSVAVKYGLRAASLHTGTPSGGHYTTVLLRGGKFFHINDAAVEEVDFNDWSSTGCRWGDVDPQTDGYVFFYERL